MPTMMPFCRYLTILFTHTVLHVILQLMPCHHVSHNLKDRIPYLRFTEGFKVNEIERLLGVKKSMIYQILTFYCNFGVTYNPQAAPFTHFCTGWPRKLSNVDLTLLKALLGQDLTHYLDELQNELLMRCGPWHCCYNPNFATITLTSTFLSKVCLCSCFGM
jgi:hypothetical protein